MRRAVTPEVARARRNFFMMVCRFYLLMGLLSIGVGCYLYTHPALLTGDPAAPRGLGIVFIAGCCVLFGILRIGLSLYHLRRFRETA